MIRLIRMDNIRQAAVANMFYPGDAYELDKLVDGFLSTLTPTLAAAPKAIIAPHAGYIYSGPIAASVYVELIRSAHTIKKVVILGPSHRVAFHGLAVTDAEFFNTPLGNVRLDQETIQTLIRQNTVTLFNQAHQLEHSIEVHLPFLQKILHDFCIIPIVVGDANTPEVSQCLESIWADSETLIVISSDLSHYHPYSEAKKLDQYTSAAIEELNFTALQSEYACGYIPIKGLLHYAKKLSLKATTLDCRNSGDTAGTKDQVVGYGAYAFN